MTESDFENWVLNLRECDDAAVHRLWDRYFQRLTEIARGKLPSNQRRAFDEEDIALSAIQSFCRGMGQGRFPVLNDEGNLWALLVLITARKAAHHVRDGQALKRGGGQVLGESAFGIQAGIEDVIAAEPSTEFAVRLFDEVDHLCRVLSDDGLRQVALLKIEGLTNREVADQLGCVERTIDRRLSLIRRIWVSDVTDAGEPSDDAS